MNPHDIFGSNHFYGNRHEHRQHHAKSHKGGLTQAQRSVKARAERKRMKKHMKKNNRRR